MQPDHGDLDRREEARDALRLRKPWLTQAGHSIWTAQTMTMRPRNSKRANLLAVLNHSVVRHSGAKGCEVIDACRSRESGHTLNNNWNIYNCQLMTI